MAFPGGPHKSKVQFTLTPDNTTVSLVDLEELGGLTNATSSIKGTSMITYLRKKDSKSVFLIVTRTLFKGTAKCDPAPVSFVEADAKLEMVQLIY